MISGGENRVGRELGGPLSVGDRGGGERVAFTGNFPGPARVGRPRGPAGLCHNRGWGRVFRAAIGYLSVHE